MEVQHVAAGEDAPSALHRGFRQELGKPAGAVERNDLRRVRFPGELPGLCCSRFHSGIKGSAASFGCRQIVSSKVVRAGRGAGPTPALPPGYREREEAHSPSTGTPGEGGGGG